MALCDICNAPGMGTVISADQMRKAALNGFDPFKLNLAPSILVSKSEAYIHWKNNLVLRDTSDWNICDKCMVHVRKYLNEAPKPKNIKHSYSYPQFNNPESAEVVRKLDAGIIDTIETIKQNTPNVTSKPAQPKPENKPVIDRYEPQRVQNETSVKSKRIWISTDKYGLLGIGIAFIVSIFPVIGSIVGGFIGGFLSRKTLNGLIGSVLGGLVFMEIFSTAEDYSGVPIWFMIIIFIVIFAGIGIIPSYVGRVAGRKYFKDDNKAKSEIKNVPKPQPSLDSNKLITCPKCKTKNIKKAKFCAKCGSKLAKFEEPAISKENELNIKTVVSQDNVTSTSIKVALNLPKGSATFSRFNNPSEGDLTSFIIHEDLDLVKYLPKEVPVDVRSAVFPRNNIGVMTVLLRINGKIYETWWNFYNPLHRTCFDDISSQEKLLVTFLADSEEPERIIWVSNPLKSGFKNAIPALKDMKPWEMNEFDAAREELYKEYPDPRVLWNSFDEEENNEENNLDNDSVVSNEDSHNLLDKLSVLENAYLVRGNPELEKSVDESLDSITAEGDPGIKLLINRLFKDMKLNNNKLIVSFTGDLAWNEWLKKRTIVDALVRANAKSALPDFKSLSTAECQYGQFNQILKPAVLKALNEIDDNEKKVDEVFNENNNNSEDFYMVISNKYTAFGSLFAEGKIKKGFLNIGDTVYIYDKDGNCKYKNKSVVKLISKESDVEKIKQGDEAVAIVFDGLINFGDIDYNDIISKKELNITPKTKKSESVKKLPTPKTYNDPDKSTHINMATNDLRSIFSSVSLGGNLTPQEEEWIKNVGEDLFNAHGFDAMQEVFINVKNRYPSITSLFSKLWDGVGGWAD